MSNASTSVDHHVTVAYYNSDDGIWLQCTCKDARGLHWDRSMGWDPTPAQLWAAEQEHLREVGLERPPTLFGTLVYPPVDDSGDDQVSSASETIDIEEPPST